MEKKVFNVISPNREKYYTKKLENLEKRERAETRRNHFKVFSFFAIIMIITAVCGIMFGNGETKTFSSLLSYLQDVPKIIPDDLWGFMDLTIESEWDVFDGLRIFINNIISIFSFGAWIGKSLVNCIPFFLYILRWFFL